MFDTLEILTQLKESFEPAQAERLARLLARLYQELADTVTKAEFHELRQSVEGLSQNVQVLAHTVQRLVEAVERQEERLTRLEALVGELIQAQQRTEERLNTLIEWQQRAEERLTRLEGLMEKLLEWQQKTEERLNTLIEWQQRAEERLTRLEGLMEKLLEWQQRAEERLTRLEGLMEKLLEWQQKMIEWQQRSEERFLRLEKLLEDLIRSQKRLEEEQKRFREELGGISDTIGYTLENAAYKALPRLLKRDYDLRVKGRLKRGYLTDESGKALEVNILGEAIRNGKRVTIIGESKARLSKKAVDQFIERRMKRLTPLLQHLFPVLVCHMISEPDVEEYAREKGIALYYSYDF